MADTRRAGPRDSQALGLATVPLNAGLLRRWLSDVGAHPYGRPADAEAPARPDPTADVTAAAITVPNAFAPEPSLAAKHLDSVYRPGWSPARIMHALRNRAEVVFGGRPVL